MNNRQSRLLDAAESAVIFARHLKKAPSRIIEAAKRVHRVAEEHEDEFIKQRNYNDNFLEKFQEAVGDLEAAARVERGFARAKYTRATAVSFAVRSILLPFTWRTT